MPRGGDQENRHDSAPPSLTPKRHLELLEEIQISSLHETSLFYFFTFYIKLYIVYKIIYTIVDRIYGQNFNQWWIWEKTYESTCNFSVNTKLLHNKVIKSGAPHPVLSLEASHPQLLSSGKIGAGNLAKVPFTSIGVYSFSFFLGLWKPRLWSPKHGTVHPRESSWDWIPGEEPCAHLLLEAVSCSDLNGTSPHR